MTPRAKTTRRPKTEASPFPEVGLAELGLDRGDRVRFRRRDTERWTNATVARREKDGSVGLHDSKGMARAIPVDLIEVRTAGPRGGVVWEALPDRVARTEQMQLAGARVPAPRAKPERGARPPIDRAAAPHAESTDPNVVDVVDNDGDGDGQLTLL